MARKEPLAAGMRSVYTYMYQRVITSQFGGCSALREADSDKIAQLQTQALEFLSSELC